MSRLGEPNSRARYRLRRVAEILVDDSSLRDNLSDAQAKQLLDWGLAHAEEAATRTALLDDDIALPIMEDIVAKIRRSMRILTRIMGLVHGKGTADCGAALIGLLKNASLLTGNSPTPAHLASAEIVARGRDPVDSEMTFQRLMSLLILDAPILMDEEE